MSQAILIELADALVSELNTESALPAGGTLGVQLVAQRAYRPQFELADLKTLRVTVVPKSIVISSAARASNQYDAAVDIAVQRKVDPANLVECRSRFTLVSSGAGDTNLNGTRTLTKVSDNLWKDLNVPELGASTISVSGNDWLLSLSRYENGIGAYQFTASRALYPCPPENNSLWTPGSYNTILPFPSISLSGEGGAGEELDALLLLVERIGDFFRLRRLSRMLAAAWAKTENAPIFSVEHLEQHGVFTSVVTLTFRIIR